ncbi:hypothetical protein [Flavobacterium sp. 3-210]
MREFNVREKNIIKKISEIDVNKLPLTKEFLEYFFFTANNQKALIINHTTRDVLYYVNPNIHNDQNESRRSFFELFELLNLLSYLKENRYISIEIPSAPFSPFETIYSEFNLAPNAQVGNIVNLNDQGDYLLSNQPDDIRNIDNQLILKGVLFNGYYDLVNNILGPIFPNEEIIDLVKNKFIPKEDRKHRQNLFVAWFGIAIAIILGIFGIWNPWGNNSIDDSKNTIQILDKLDSIKNNSSKNFIEIKELNIKWEKQFIQKNPDALKKQDTLKKRK